MKPENTNMMVMNTNSKTKMFLQNSATIALFDNACDPCSVLLLLLRIVTMKIATKIIGQNTVRTVAIINTSKTIIG